MALGEYVSVSAQRDTEQALLQQEWRELRADPSAELDELAALLEGKGLSAATARTAAEELTDHDPMVAHAEVELGFDPAELTKPWQARAVVRLVVQRGRVAAADRHPGRTRPHCGSRSPSRRCC